MIKKAVERAKELLLTIFPPREKGEHDKNCEFEIVVPRESYQL